MGDEELRKSGGVHIPVGALLEKKGGAHSNLATPYTTPIHPFDL